MVTIYLSGGIKGLTDEQAFGWRHEVCKHHGCREDGVPYLFGGQGCGRPEIGFIIPTRIEYRPDMSVKAAAEWIIKRDKMAIARSDILLVYAPVPSWGTAMEILYAHDLDKRVIVVCDNKCPSPWLLAHADALVPTFSDAYREIDSIVRDMEELNL